MTLLLVNTFDVEPWWATIPPCVTADEWHTLPDRSERPLHEYLDLCDEAGVRCTFFFVGWYARRFPHCVAEIVRRGHEAGCHSLQHQDMAQLSVPRFEADTRAAKDMIEDATGAAVMAYRAPSFSWPTERSAEFWHVLEQLGFRIDSSISTARRLHGGGFDKRRFPEPVNLQQQYGVNILEIPVPGVTLGGRDLQLFGGGYLRVAPRWLINRLARREQYQVLYLHPHDFDRSVPPLPGAGAISNLRRRANVGSLSHKVQDLFRQAKVRSCGELLAEFDIVKEL